MVVLRGGRGLLLSEVTLYMQARVRAWALGGQSPRKGPPLPGSMSPLSGSPDVPEADPRSSLD